MDRLDVNSSVDVDEAALTCILNQPADLRNKWLIDTISKLLDIDDSVCLRSFCEENGTDLLNFFDSIADEKMAKYQVLFVWKTYQDKVVEENITVLEPIGIFKCN